MLDLMGGETAHALQGKLRLVQASEDRRLRPYPDRGAEEQG
jgi:hypothetical protein